MPHSTSRFFFMRVGNDHNLVINYFVFLFFFLFFASVKGIPTNACQTESMNWGFFQISFLNLWLVLSFLGLINVYNHIFYLFLSLSESTTSDKMNTGKPNRFHYAQTRLWYALNRAFCLKFKFTTDMYLCFDDVHYVTRANIRSICLCCIDVYVILFIFIEKKNQRRHIFSSYMQRVSITKTISICYAIETIWSHH